MTHLHDTVGPHMRRQPTLREMAEYTSLMADNAQIRKLDRRSDDNSPIYDDYWWQSVMDFVRYELAILADKYEPKK